MYKVFKDNKGWSIYVADENGEKIGIKGVASFEFLSDANIWCDKLQISYDIGWEHGSQLGNIED